MVVAFIGHRVVDKNHFSEKYLFDLIEKLIVEENADTFLFGSKSKFNDICYAVVTELKEKYPHISRVYVRAEYRYIDNSYEKYLFEFYEKTIFPDKVCNAGLLSYIKRNEYMIDSADKIVFYLDSNCMPKQKCGKVHSGTYIANQYVIRTEKSTVNIYF